MNQLFVKLSHAEPFSFRPWEMFRVYKRQPGYRLKKHAHPHMQMLHVLEGELEVHFGEGWRVLREGDVHVLPPGYEHALRSPKGYTQCGANLLNQDERGMHAAILRAFTEPTLFHMRFKESWGPLLSLPVLTRANAQSFRLLHLLDDYGISLLETRESGPDDVAAQELLDFCHQNLHRHVQVEEMVAGLNRGRATLQRICKKHFYCGLAHLHERLRMKRIAEQMLESDISVSECSRQWGFKDVYHFSRSFKRIIGASPREHRKKHLQMM